MGFITLAFFEPTLLMQKIGPNGPLLSGLKKNYYSSNFFQDFPGGRILIERMDEKLTFLLGFGIGSRIHERTISLRFLSIISDSQFSVHRLEVSVYNVYSTN